MDYRTRILRGEGRFVVMLSLPPDDSLIWRDEDTAKLRRRAGEAVGRRARAGRRKSLDAIVDVCVSE